jgi:hypothetical protein
LSKASRGLFPGHPAREEAPGSWVPRGRGGGARAIPVRRSPSADREPESRAPGVGGCQYITILSAGHIRGERYCRRPESCHCAAIARLRYRGASLCPRAWASSCPARHATPGGPHRLLASIGTHDAPGTAVISELSQYHPANTRVDNPEGIRIYFRPQGSMRPWSAARGEVGCQNKDCLLQALWS